MLEKRRHAYRADLADLRLKGQVEAAEFRAGTLMQMRAPIATLHRAPAIDAPQETQVLCGETCRVFDVANGWAWVQLIRDQYVGYMKVEFLSAETHAPTHAVSVPSTLLYTKPDLKTQPVQFLYMNSAVTLVAHHQHYAEVSPGGFVIAEHLSPISEPKQDFVAVAEQFLNTPYLWGGKSHHGVDCSGLVQTALHACGAACPRDADMQEAEVGKPLLLNSLDGLKRGDLIFWQGHVGIMRDDVTLLHASGHQMLVVSEPLAQVDERSKAKGKNITTIRRI